MPIKVALVGFGLSGRYLQAPFFAANPAFQLQSVVTQQSLADLGWGYLQRLDSLDEVLANPSIDLVSICTPNATHFEYAQRCLQAGKHILVEKPFTATVSEAEALMALAQAQQRHIFVFQNRRFDSDFLTIRRLLDEGKLGQLLRYEAHYNRFKPQLNAKPWKETPAPGTGLLYDLGPHIIDQAIALFGAPKSVWGQKYIQRSGASVDDAFDLFLDYGHLKVVLTASLMVREPAPRYVLQGTDASFFKYGLDMQEDHLKAGQQPGDETFGVEPAPFWGRLVNERDGAMNVTEITSERGNWGILFQNIADVLLQGAVPLIPLSEVVEQIRVMEQVRMV